THAVVWNSSRKNWFCPTVSAPSLCNGRSRLRQCGLFGADQLRQQIYLFNQVQRNERRLDRWRRTRVRDRSSLEREGRVPVLRSRRQQQDGAPAVQWRPNWRDLLCSQSLRDNGEHCPGRSEL